MMAGKGYSFIEEQFFEGKDMIPARVCLTNAFQCYADICVNGRSMCPS